jgi:transcriptional regulator with XRE-family HTH domain
MPQPVATWILWQIENRTALFKWRILMSTVPSHPSSNGNGSSNAPHSNGNGHVKKPLHCISDVRRRQGITLRTVARRWDLDVSDIRDLENETADLTLRQLYAWQELLEVPIHELLLDSEMPLSAPVLRRAQLLRLMKTAVTLSEKSSREDVQYLIHRLMDQILEIMPELKSVGPWHESEERTDLREKQVYRLPESH